MTLEEVSWSTEVLEVVVLPRAGCRLHRLRAFGVDLLRTPDDPAAHLDDPFTWGAYVMAPWTNRARPGRRVIAGREVTLAPNFPDGTAIHGHVLLAPWERTGETTFTVHRNEADWPWPYRVTADLAVADARLELTLRLLNESDAPMPAGIGLHPWFRRPVHVGVSAHRMVPRNDDPDAEPVATLALDVDQPLPDGLDGTWLAVDPPEIRLRWPVDGVAATLRMATDRPPHVAVASPPDAVAVEPVTHVPWGLDRLAEGRDGAIPLLAPDQAVELRLTLEAHRS